MLNTFTVITIFNTIYRYTSNLVIDQRNHLQRGNLTKLGGTLSKIKVGQKLLNPWKNGFKTFVFYSKS